MVVGGSRRARDAVVADRIRAAGIGVKVHESPAAAWPFAQAPGDGIPAGPVLVVARALHEAFPAGQTGGTRLVLTQSSWQMQRWLEWLERRPDASLIADADAGALREAAPEAYDRRGPWARIARIDIDASVGPAEPSEHPDAAVAGGAGVERSDLLAAFSTTDPAERLARCRRAAEAAPRDAVVLTALGSAYMEVQDLDAALTALEAAVAAAPEWEAPRFELGKLWLRRDDLERAAAAFAEAGRLMPGFSAAFSNLGAALGELGRSDEALRAFRQALAFDPHGYTTLNNIGVLSRETGRLDEAEAAFRKVVAVAPDFVFGHYNLGHTLFLQGRYQAALSAYAEGQRRDPEKNARQACRLAVIRLAAGDAEGAVGDLRRYVPALAADQRRDALAEAQEIVWALLTTNPALPGWRRVADLVKAELEALG